MMKSFDRLLLRGVVCALLAFTVFVLTPEYSSAQNLQEFRSKIHFRLLDLFKRGSPPPAQKEGLVRVDEFGRVQVYIQAEPITEQLLDKIIATGAKIDGQAFGVIQAWIPISSLEALAAFGEVRYVRPPDYAHPNVGSVTTSGDSVLGLATVRQNFEVTGQGVRVGVISSGLTGLPQSIASGDLPPATFHCRSVFFFTVTLRSNGCLSGEILVQTSGGIIAKPFPSDGNLAASGSKFAEGTALLEIIRDIAPGAELWFVNGQTTVDLLNAATFLAANVDVLVSDIGFHGVFPNGQNNVSKAVAQIAANAANRARAYIQSAGNHSDKHYSGGYTASSFNDGFGNYHLFSANSETSGPSPSVINCITVPPLSDIKVYLSWNDPAGASTNNYDLLLIDRASGSLLDVSIETQAGFTEPQETVSFINVSLVSVDVCYAIWNFLNLAAPVTLNVTFDGGINHWFNTRGKSLLAPADATGDLIAVGAVPASFPNTIEPFSSRGPTFDGRAKPDLVATDGVSVTGAGDFNTPFFGTSAAAPHVAGLAALLLELNPSLTRAGLKSVLKQSAVPLGDANVFGSGRINGVGAANLVLASMPSFLAAAVLPSSRSVQVGATASAFATIINAGTSTASLCGISLLSSIPANFSYQTTNPATNQVTGTPNTPVNIGAGLFQSYVFALTPTAPIAPTDVLFTFDCTNTNPAANISGVNTLLFLGSAGPTSDIVALAGTLSNDGIVNIPGTFGTGVFVVATVNVGVSGTLAVSADTGGTTLPVVLSICQTNPVTGACLAPPSSGVATTVNAGATPTFGIFVQGTGNVAFNPATNRIFMRFKDGGGITHGSTSVAVRTQ